MANPSVTYTFTNSTTADGTQVSQNFTDLINGMTDGTKSFSIDALTVGGAALFNGAVTLGNATSDTITLTGYISGSIIGSTTGGVPQKGRTDGGTVSVGDIGETLTTSAVDVATNTSGATAISSLTLTTGTWRVSASSERRAAATQTGANHVLEIKGVGGSTKGKDYIDELGHPAQSSNMITFPVHTVVIASGDANKTVRVTQTSHTAAGLGCSFISAERIA